MIIKSYDLKNNIKKDINIYLLYGQNTDLIDEVINKYIKNSFSDNLYNYEESEILFDKNKFKESIFNKSFFETEKLIIINRTTDKILDLIKDVVEKKDSDLKIILKSNILEKKSKLRNFFEKEKSLVCIPFYPDDFKSLNFIAQNFFKEKKIKISQETVNLIIERSNGSRQHLKNELEKIGLYTVNKKKVEFSEIIKLTNLGKNYNITELVETCLVKNQKKISKIINENNFSNEDTIIIIRTFLLKTKRLLNLSKNIKSNPNLETVISNYKPSIFWKEKEIVKQQLKIWSEKSLGKLINEINNTELLIKKNTDISLNVLLNFIFTNSKITNS